MGRRVVTSTLITNHLMRNLLFLMVTGSVLSCVQSVDIKGPDYVRKPVLLGILHPDSLLKVKLNWSRPTTTASLSSPIQNARVTFYRDGILLGKSSNSEEGVYSLPLKPQVGYMYKVEVSITDLPLITAEDYIPEWGNTELHVSNKTSLNTNNNPDIICTLEKNLPKNSFLWVGLYSTRYSSRGWPPGCIISGQVQPGCDIIIVKNIGDNHVTTRSPIFDSFNGFFDPLSDHFSNNSPARVRSDLFNSQINPVITFSPFNQGEERWDQAKKPNDQRPLGENVLEITFAGPAYDRYLKSALLAYQNRLTDFDGNIFSPFAEPSPVYSNVTNGLGIFGARNGRYIVLKLNTTYQLTP